MNEPVLVLNANFEPINVCSTRRAIGLILSGKADMVVNGRGHIHTVAQLLPRPSVIRLEMQVHRPRPHVKLTRREVFRRDNYTCQYCGRRDGGLTVDHVVPRHLGGAHTWTNVVAACQSSGLGVTWSNGPGTYAGAGTATSTSGSTFTQDSLTISGVDANCNGKNMKVVLANSAGTAVATSNVVTAATGTTVVSNTDWASGSPFDTKSVSQVTVTIYG